jgi:hypothetical protein
VLRVSGSQWWHRDSRWQKWAGVTSPFLPKHQGPMYGEALPGERKGNKLLNKSMTLTGTPPKNGYFRSVCTPNTPLQPTLTAKLPYWS